MSEWEGDMLFGRYLLSNLLFYILYGNKSAQKGLEQLYAYRGGKKPKWKQIKEVYRIYLYQHGLEVLGDPETGAIDRLGFTIEQLEIEIQRNGKIPASEILLHRVRYFTDGAIIWLR